MAMGCMLTFDNSLLIIYGKEDIDRQTGTGSEVGTVPVEGSNGKLVSLTHPNHFTMCALSVERSPHDLPQ